MIDEGEQTYSMGDFSTLFYINQFEQWLNEQQYMQLWETMRKAYWQLDTDRNIRDKRATAARSRAIEAARNWGNVNYIAKDGSRGFPTLYANYSDYHRDRQGKLFDTDGKRYSFINAPQQVDASEAF